MRLQEAVSEQFEGKYQVVVGVLIGKPVPTASTLGKWRPELKQLPSQAGLATLKSGSRRLRVLDWNLIADKVRSRHELQCCMHFYGIYNNANRGRWLDEASGRLKEGVGMFELDYGKVAEHIGMRSPHQAISLLSAQKNKKKRQKKPWGKMKPATPNPQSR